MTAEESCCCLTVQKKRVLPQVRCTKKVSGRRAKTSLFLGSLLFLGGEGERGFAGWLTEEPWEENLIYLDQGFGVSFKHFHSEGSLKRPPPQLFPSSLLYSAKQTRLSSTCVTSDLFKEEEGGVSLSVTGPKLCDTAGLLSGDFCPLTFSGRCAGPAGKLLAILL